MVPVHRLLYSGPGQHKILRWVKYQFTLGFFRQALLGDKGVDANLPSGKGATAMHLAAFADNAEAAAILVRD